MQFRQYSSRKVNLTSRPFSNKTENEASMDLDSSQQEQEVAITSCEMIAHDPSQQASSTKYVKASEMILDATIELQQPCVPMPRAFVMDGTSKDSEMEHDLASNIEGTKVQTKKSTLSNVKKSSPASTVRKLQVSTVSSECYFKKLLFVRFSIFFNVFYFYEVLLYTDISNEKGVITLPLTWSISQAPVKLGIEIILCQIKTLMENDKKNLAVKKYIVIADWSENDFKHLQNNYTDVMFCKRYMLFSLRYSFNILFDGIFQDICASKSFVDLSPVLFAPRLSLSPIKIPYLSQCW
ncbi:uncharacterized protein LOC112466470 isoform X1 [Temnothorax curvispinosus]|uniref:Uncharacterized protein LOC112466470 isoform X1 n=1 Tax=Temnothorax curvispinosus TaxID=300111 RepID=A0A6J1R6Q9_9HYME|nr:uncharacterized protein LOC112466470 isoform X1 [Temnothorax curvispinosus]